MMKQSITRNGKTYTSAGDYLVSLARNSGSTACTATGALTYLKTRRIKENPQLASLGTAQFCSVTRHTFEWNGRTTRIEASARVLAEEAALNAKPFARLKKLTKKFTSDIYPIARRSLEALLGEKIAKTISGRAWPYRRAESGWAGGRHTTRVVFSDTPQAKGESTRVWSANGKWSGNDSSACLSVTPRCYELLGTNLTMGGLVTLDCIQVAPREYQAWWAEQSRGFSLKVVAGWIIRGYHVTGGTLEQARKKAAFTRAQAALNAAFKHASIDRTLLAGVMVQESDSWRAGNCKSGTSSFISTFTEKIGTRREIQAIELLALRDDLYTRRAVIAALARHTSMLKTVAETTDRRLT